MNSHLTPPPCSWVTEKLSSFLDGELGTDNSERISGHLEGCLKCRAALSDEVALVSSVIEGLAPGRPSADLSRRIVAALPHDLPAESRTSWRGLAAAALLLAVGGLLMNFGVSPTPGIPTETGIEMAALPPGPAATPAPRVIRRGDVDGNGEFNFSDLLLLQGIMGKSADEMTETASCPAGGDFDEDGKITPQDTAAAALQLAHVAGQYPLHNSVPKSYPDLMAYTGNYPCTLLNCP